MRIQFQKTSKGRVLSDIPTQGKIDILVDWLLEKKAEELLALDLSGQAQLSEAVIIASATSPRHAKGMADFLLEEGRKQRFEFLHMEGYTQSEWILLDFNDVVVHIFDSPARELYMLDDMWPDAEVLAGSRDSGL